VIEVLFWLCALVVVCVMTLLGLMPEQRARRRALRLARDAQRKARDDERASREQLREWREEAAQQMFDGTAGFADEAEAQTVLSGRGGRKSPLDGRKFK
jgi:hypothetical protein